MTESTLKRLYVSLSERWRPEDVAVIVKHADDLDPRIVKLLSPVCPRWRTSAMPTQFEKPKDLSTFLRKAKELFPDIAAPSVNATESQIAGYVAFLSQHLGLGSDFEHRLTRKQRFKHNARTLPYRGHRAYNKRARFVIRFSRRFARFQAFGELTEMARVAKVRLAHQIDRRQFLRDEYSAVLIAYITARLGVRSLFTWSRQMRAFDEVAEALFNLAEHHGKPAWFALAHVLPTPRVMQHLSDAQKGKMLGKWYEIMVRCCDLGESLFDNPSYNVERLVVKRGNDSSRWNELAGAFNKARDGWINSLYAIGAEALLETHAPPKWLRLMAADVVFMHSRYGSGGLEPDTAVWQDLPKPWKVVKNGARCDRQMIEDACARHGVKGKGWIAPRGEFVEDFTPTPELLHGVIVESAALGTLLKKQGYFAGPSKRKRSHGPVAGIVKVYDSERGVVGAAMADGFDDLGFGNDDDDWEDDDDD